MVMNRALKVLVFIVALSYTVYGFYWFIKGTFWFVDVVLNPGDYLPPTGILFVNSTSLFAANLMDYSAFLGLIARAIGGIYAVLVAYQLIKAQNNFFIKIKGKLLIVLICEAVYFLSLIPSIFFLLGFSALSLLSNLFLSAQLTIQVLLVVPCLVMLALKLRKTVVVETAGLQVLLKLSAVLFLSYIFVLWLSYQLKWLELFNGAQVSFSTVLEWLIENARLLSFLNATIILTAALFFAILGTKYVVNLKTVKAVKFWSFSAFFVGLFFVFYVTYCVYLGVLWVIPFGELWIISLLFVGTYFMIHPFVNDEHQYKKAVYVK
jgi:hypothetical protein